MTDARRFEPPASDLTQPFWDATREHRLLIQWCTACDAPVWFPREVCLHCLGNALEWREASGTGSVYAFLVEHRPNLPGVFGDAPYVVALVELDEGVRLMTNVVGCPTRSRGGRHAGARHVGAALRRPQPAAVRTGVAVLDGKPA